MLTNSTLPPRLSLLVGRHLLTIFDEVELADLGLRRPRRARGGERVLFVGSGHGELQIARFLANALQRQGLAVDWWLTSFFSAGHQSLAAAEDERHLLRVNLWPTAGALLKHTQPTLLCVLEHCYPTVMGALMRLASGWLEIPALLLGARVEEDWVSEIQRQGPTTYYMYRRAFKSVTFAVTDNESTATTLDRLGVGRGRIAFSHALKWNCSCPGEDQGLRHRLRKQWGIPRDNLILVCGSMHETELSVLLESLREAGLERRARLVVAPHATLGHVSAGGILARCGYPRVALWSEWERSLDPSVDVVLVDTFGDLARLYAVGDLAFVGGSFEPGWEGHNLAEPAAHGVAIITGPSHRAFSSMAQSLAAGGGLLVAGDRSALARALREVASSGPLRRDLGRRAYTVYESFACRSPLELELLRRMLVTSERSHSA